MDVFAIAVGLPILLAGLLLLALVVISNRLRNRARQEQERDYFKRLNPQ